MVHCKNIILEDENDAIISLVMDILLHIVFRFFPHRIAAQKIPQNKYKIDYCFASNNR